MKKMMLIAIGYLAIFATNNTRAEICAVNQDDVSYVVPRQDPLGLHRPTKFANRAEGAITPASFLASDKEVGVRISSLCSIASSYVTQSRSLKMAQLAGVSVETDRSKTPAAAYVPPVCGWQLWDGVSSTNSNYKIWMGSSINTNSATAGELGHRMVVSAAGRSPISNYWCKIFSSSTNYGTFFFEVGKSSSGQEIAFNAQFVGISFGSNGILDSYIDQTTGTWVQVGDDHIYSNGELPSTVSYDWWYRFGATVSINVGNYAGFNPLQREFASSQQSFTAELVVRTNSVDTTVHSLSIYSADVVVGIANNGDHQVLLQAKGGQTLLSYDILTKTVLEDPLDPWVQINVDQGVLSGQQWNVGAPDPKRFYMLRAKAP